MPRPAPWQLALLAALALATLVLWPGISYPTQGLIGHESIDVWSHVWGMHWFVSELASGRIPWEVSGAAWPERRVLWYVDPLGALLTAPLQLISPALAWNGLLYVQISALFMAGWLWGRSLGGRGWLAGAALATTPGILGELWNGVSEAAWLAPVALAGWAAARRSRWTGLAVGLALICTPYHGLGAALLVTAVLLMGGAPYDAAGGVVQRRPSAGTRLGELVMAGLLAALLAAPFLWALKASTASPEAFVNRPFFQGWNEPTLLSNAVDPRALVTPGDFWSVPFNDSIHGISWRRTPYLGLGLLGLSVLGLVRRPRHWPVLLAGLVAAVATLGHFLWLDEQWVRTADGGRYLLPLGMLRENLGIALEHPMRFSATVVVCLAGLADAGLGRGGEGPVARWLGRAAVALAPLLVFEHLVLAPNAWPIATSPAGLPTVHTELPEDGLAVVDLPADSGFGMRTDRYLYWQALHDRPVPWNNRVGSSGTASMNPALRTMVLLSKKDPGPPGSPGVPEADADLEAALAELEAAGLGYVLVHPWMFEKDRLEREFRSALDPLLGEPEVRGDAWVYRLGPARGDP